MTDLRRVTKAEYDVLTKYHPGEIRYYVNFEQCKKSEPKKFISKAVKKINRPFLNAHLQLSPKGLGQIRSGTTQYVIYHHIKRILKSDPTEVMRYSELLDTVCGLMSGFDRNNQIHPAFKRLIDRGAIRFTGEELLT